ANSATMEPRPMPQTTARVRAAAASVDLFELVIQLLVVGVQLFVGHGAGRIGDVLALAAAADPPATDHDHSQERTAEEDIGNRPGGAVEAFVDGRGEGMLPAIASDVGGNDLIVGRLLGGLALEVAPSELLSNLGTLPRSVRTATV